MLEMRNACERCDQPLGQDTMAFICSYECTFCPACATGELVHRPRRPAVPVSAAAS